MDRPNDSKNYTYNTKHSLTMTYKLCFGERILLLLSNIIMIYVAYRYPQSRFIYPNAVKIH